MTRRRDTGNTGERRLGHLVASENATPINTTMAIPLVTSVVAKISAYVGRWYPNPAAIVCRNIDLSDSLILGKSHARCVPPCNITPTTIPPAMTCTRNAKTLLIHIIVVVNGTRWFCLYFSEFWKEFNLKSPTNN